VATGKPRGVRAHPTRVHVILVEPLPLVRAGLERLIAERPELRIRRSTGDPDEGVDALARPPNRTVAVVGLGLEGARDWQWTIRTMKARAPSTAVLACGARSDAMAVSLALFAGADGFVDKTAEPEEFLDALVKAVDGEMVMAGPPPEWVGTIAAGLERRRAAGASLTEREREVLDLAADGLTAREIGERLGVRERTITTHLSRIYGKLGVGGRLRAIRVATRSGLLVQRSTE
jgi:two-component system, NarL family, nitrate/nitrite response regulator NarL